MLVQVQSAAKSTGYRTERLTLISCTGRIERGLLGFEALEVFLPKIAVGGDMCIYWRGGKGVLALTVITTTAMITAVCLRVERRRWIRYRRRFTDRDEL